MPPTWSTGTAAFAGFIFGIGIGRGFCYLHFYLLLSLPTDGGFYKMKVIASEAVFVWDVKGSWAPFLAIKNVHRSCSPLHSVKLITSLPINTSPAHLTAQAFLTGLARTYIRYCKCPFLQSAFSFSPLAWAQDTALPAWG